VIPYFCAIIDTIWYNAYMLDWFSGRVGYSGEELKLNRILEVTPDGSVLWNSERKIQAKGSYESSIQIGRGYANEAMLKASERHNLLVNDVCLYMSGNPSKFLQGHNVFGPGVSSLGPVVTATVRGLPAGVRPADADNSVPPALYRNRVDITTSVHLGQHRIVHEWLQTVARSSRSRHGRAMVSGDTVYWGKTSQRWTMKAYCKYCELEAHPPADLEFKSQLKEYCEGHLRLELSLRTLELQDRGTLDESLIWEYMRKINIGVMKMDVDETGRRPNLPRIIQHTFDEWLAGKDVRFELNKRTFYRHRKAILDATGLDISLPVPDKQTLGSVKFDLDYLVANEIKEIPSLFQGRLFKPDESPDYPAH